MGMGIGARTAVFSAVLFSAPLLAAFAPANRPYDAAHYRVRLTIDPAKNEGTFDAESEMRFKAKTALSSITVDAKDLAISKVLLVKPTKRPLEFKQTGDQVEVTFPGTMRKGEQWTLAFAYRGKINTANEGLFRVNDPDEPTRGPLLVTQFESSHARQFLPCNDEPYDKATTEIEVTIPARYDAVANGVRAPERKVKRDGESWHTVSWRMEKPHPTYLMALAIGVFGKVADKHKGKELSIYAGPGKIERTRFALQVTKDTISFLESYTGVPYPWPRYSIVGVPTFLWGGMENTTSTFQNEGRTALTEPGAEVEKGRIAGLTAHEIAHQWFGDYVTMSWWDDLWLNEAFASFFGTLATKSIFKNEEAELWAATETWEDYFRQEDGPRSHPIVDKKLTESGDSFDAISYTKGEAVLRMLRFYLGEEKFRKGIKGYLTKHALGNATYLDFFAAMQTAAGEDLGRFRDSWLLQRGYPVLGYKGTWDGTTSVYSLTLSQRANHPEDKSIFQFRVPVSFHRRAAPAYDRTFAVTMGQAERVDKYTLPAEPEWVTVNPGAIALVKVDPTNRDEAVIAAQALGDPDPIARVWAALELLRPFKEGGSLEAPAERTLIQFLKSDPSPYARIGVLDAIRKSKARWLPSKLGDTVLELATAAVQKDSERQPLHLSDKHGWSQYRSQLLGAVGRVKRSEAQDFIGTQLARRDLPLDDLSEAAKSAGSFGDAKAGTMLREAQKAHGPRGYKYQYVVQYAFGAWENKAAAAEIAEMAKTSGSDLMGRLGWLVRDNQTLKASSEWAQFLREFALKSERFDDEVKVRLLQSIEEVKSEPVKQTLEAIAKESGSARLKELAQKILEKNFPPPQAG